MPRSTRSRVPPPRADQKTCSAEHTLPRISLGLGAQPNTHRDRRGPGQLAGGVLRPSTCPARPRPMRTDAPGRGGLPAISLHFMVRTTWLSPRFYSDITSARSTVEVRVQIGQNPRPRTPCEHAAKRQPRRSHEQLQKNAQNKMGDGRRPVSFTRLAAQVTAVQIQSACSSAGKTQGQLLKKWRGYTPLSLKRRSAARKDALKTP